MFSKSRDYVNSLTVDERIVFLLDIDEFKSWVEVYCRKYTPYDRETSDDIRLNYQINLIEAWCREVFGDRSFTGDFASVTRAAVLSRASQSFDSFRRYLLVIADVVLEGDPCMLQ